MLKRMSRLLLVILLIGLAASPCGRTISPATGSSSGDGRGQRQLHLSCSRRSGEKLTGTYSGLFGKADLTGSVKGDQIDFTFKFDYNGQNGVAHYSGTIESDKKMKGKVEVEGLGEGTWTGTKQ